MARTKEFNFDDKLKVARDLFWEQGYHTTSLNDLVKKLQLNRSSIYESYGSKHNLFILCLKDYISLKQKSYLKSAAKSTSPIKAVETIIRDIVDTILLDTRTCLAVNSTFELGRVDKDAAKLLKYQAEKSVKLFEDLLKKAQKKGEIAQNRDPEILAYFIVSNFASLWNAEILFSDKKRLKQLTDFLINSVIN